MGLRECADNRIRERQTGREKDVLWIDEKGDALQIEEKGCVVGR